MIATKSLISSPSLDVSGCLYNSVSGDHSPLQGSCLEPGRINGGLSQTTHYIDPLRVRTSDAQLIIDKLYVGHWYWDAIPYQLSSDLHDLPRCISVDLDPTVADLRIEWKASH